MRRILLCLTTLSLLAGPAVGAAAQGTKSRAMATTSAVPVADLVRRVDIPYSKFTLPNGLRVLVHEDRKAPIVAVSSVSIRAWYIVSAATRIRSPASPAFSVSKTSSRAAWSKAIVRRVLP